MLLLVSAEASSSKIGGESDFMTARKASVPPMLETKRLTQDEVRRAIARLLKRAEEVKVLQTSGARYDAPEVDVVESEIRSTILEIFGENSHEFRENQYFDVTEGSQWLGMSEHECQARLVAGIPHALAKLQGLISRLEERLENSPADAAKSAFRGLTIHPRIKGVSAELFQNGHYAEAVFGASKALVNMVKEKSGIYDIEGASLMQNVFSPNKPILVFNEMKDQTDRDEQQGMMFLYTGAISAIRNPRGHENMEDDPNRALEYLVFISMLASRVEEARKK